MSLEESGWFDEERVVELRAGTLWVTSDGEESEPHEKKSEPRRLQGEEERTMIIRLIGRRRKVDLNWALSGEKGRRRW
jgi:hypothetical protein